MIGLLFGSTLVSSLSAAMIELRESKKDKTAKMRVLRQYLLENSVPPRLSTLVTRQVQKRLACPERLMEDEVKALLLLSPALRAELRIEIFGPHLQTQPLFRFFIIMDHLAVQRLCLDSMRFENLVQSDELFAPGQEADAAYILIEGRVEYDLDRAFADPNFSVHVTPVEKGTWLSEAALWSEWIHVGRAEAAIVCELIVISAPAFAASVSASSALQPLAAQYCKQFHARIVSAKPPLASYPTDLEVPYTEFSELVGSMSRDTQVAISKVALHHLKQGRSFNRAGSRTLSVEVRTGQSLVLFDREGAVLRVINLVTIRLARSDGRILAQIAKGKNMEWTPGCMLPGAKQLSDELAVDTASRMLSDGLRFLNDAIGLGRFEHVTELAMSKEFQVPTRYNKTIIHADFKEGVDPDDLPIEAVSRRTRFAAKRTFTTHSLTLRPADELADDLDLLAKEVFVAFDSGGVSRAFAWLTAGEFDCLASPTGEQALDKWVGGLDLPAKPSRPSVTGAALAPEDFSTPTEIFPVTPRS